MGVSSKPRRLVGHRVMQAGYRKRGVELVIKVTLPADDRRPPCDDQGRLSARLRADRRGPSHTQAGYCCNDEKEFCPMSRRTGWSVLLLFSAFTWADQVTIERDARMSTQRLEKVAPLQGVSAFRADGADEPGPDETPHRTQRTGAAQDLEWDAPGLIPRRSPR
jgi:hypothetical protein